VSRFQFAAGRRAPFGHRHREQEEVYVVIAGSGRMKLDDDVVDLKQWDVVRVAPQVARAIEAGDSGIEYIAVGNDRPEGGDGERVNDFWSD
jgi:mannose-6-phosphate isomerase-like protein (cupin superfamily)